MEKVMAAKQWQHHRQNDNSRNSKFTEEKTSNLQKSNNQPAAMAMAVTACSNSSGTMAQQVAKGDGIQQEQRQHHWRNSSGSIIGKGTVAKLQIKNLSKKQQSTNDDGEDKSYQ